MTVSAQTPINRSTGNGVTTVFPYTFKIISSADMEVSVDGVVKTLTVDYTLSGVGNDAGGNVTMLAAPANGTSVVRRRNMALTRSTDYQDQGELPASTLDSDLDSAVLMIQQVDEKTDRAMVLPADVSGFSTELPTPIANYFLRVNSAGTALELASEITPGALTVTPFIETLLNDSTQADARATIGAAASGALASSGITGAAASGANTDITSLSSPAIAAATATTQAGTDNTTKVATTAMVQAALKQSGKVLKVQGFTDSGGSTTSTSAVNMNASLWNYTPVSTNSSLYLIVSGQCYATSLGSSAGYCYFWIGEYTGVYNVVSAAIALQNQQYSTTYAQQTYAPLVIQVKLNNTALTARQFDIMGASFNAGVTIGAGGALTVIEVAN